MNVIILAGMPASGKTTICKKLAEDTGYIVLEKDKIKEALFDTLGWNCYTEKRKLDHAANATLLICAEEILKTGNSLIIDNNFDDISTEKVNDLITRYNCKCITVFLGGNNDVFYKRYIDRDNSHLRHLGHSVQDHYPLFYGESIEYEMSREEFAEKFERRGIGAFRCVGNRIDVDASADCGIDVSELIAKIRYYILQSGD